MNQVSGHPRLHLFCPKAYKGAILSCLGTLDCHILLGMFQFGCQCAPKQIQGLIRVLATPDPTRGHHVVLVSCIPREKVERSKPACRGFLLGENRPTHPNQGKQDLGDHKGGLPGYARDEWVGTAWAVDQLGVVTKGLAPKVGSLTHC